MENKTWNQEQNELLTTIFDYRFFSIWNKDFLNKNPNQTKLWQNSGLILSFNSLENKCEYCNFKSEIKKTPNKISEVLSYIEEKNWYLPWIKIVGASVEEIDDISPRLLNCCNKIIITNPNYPIKDSDKIVYILNVDINHQIQNKNNVFYNIYFKPADLNHPEKIINLTTYSNIHLDPDISEKWTDNDLTNLYNFTKNYMEYKYKNDFSALVLNYKNQIDTYGNFIFNNEYLSCDINTSITININTLELYACPLLDIKKLILGKIENNSIIAENPYLGIKIYMANNNATTPKCDSCAYQKYCPQQCYYAQFIKNKDPLIPDFSICDIYFAKFNAIADFYFENNLLDYLYQIVNKTQDTDIQHLITFLMGVYNAKSK